MLSFIEDRQVEFLAPYLRLTPLLALPRLGSAGQDLSKLSTSFFQGSWKRIIPNGI